MKIGIVGSGIAGLSSAWLFGSVGHQVVVYERNDRGPEGQSIAFDDHGRSPRLDVPSRLLNPVQWPTLLKLYRLAGVDVEPIDTSQTFSCLHQKPYLDLNLTNIFKANPRSLLNETGRTIIAEILRLRKQGPKDLANGISEDVRLADYLAEAGYRIEFIYGFLFPVLSSTVCTCSYESLVNYPAHIILDALAKIAVENSGEPDRLMRAKYGMRDVTRRLLSHGPRMETGTDVTSVKHCEDHVEVRYRQKTADSGSTGNESHVAVFDHVIIATQANQAGKLLNESAGIERDMLECFEYENVEIVVHCDPGLMPRHRKSWSTFNMISTELAVPEASSMCSIWINRLDKAFNAETDVFQTINPIVEPDSKKVIFRRRLQRPVVNQNSWRGWSLFDRICCETERRIWFAGSYACCGVPLLETGVKSAVKVAGAIGIESELTNPDAVGAV